MDSPYNQITVLLFATALIGLFALRLRQPIIVAYIIVGIVAATAHSRQDGKHLRDAGADQVLTPFTDAADHAARRIAATLQQKEE